MIDEKLMEEAVAFRIKWDMTLYEALDILIKYQSKIEIRELRSTLYEIGTVIFDK